MELTASQLNKLPAYRDFWRQQVISTSGVDRTAAERAVRRLYRALNRPEPNCFLWFDAPREAAGAAHILLLEQDPEFFAEYWGQLVRQKRAEWERVRTLIVSQSGVTGWETVRRDLIPPPTGDGRCRVGFAFLTRALRAAGVAPWLPFGKRYNHFISAAEDRSTCTKEDRRRELQEYERIRKLQEQTDPLRMLQEDVDEVEWFCFYSFFHPAYVSQALIEGLAQWTDPEFKMRGISFGQLARLEFLAKECGESFPAAYVSLLDVARQVNLWWALDKVAVLCDRPADLWRNPAGQLHNLEGPALVYRNGWRVYSVKGEMVDPVIVLPREQITFELIETHRPLKKILVERYGKARYRAEATDRRRAEPPPVLRARLPVEGKDRLEFLRESALGRLPLYERYHSGDCISVWNDLAALGERSRSAEHAADALAVAYATMDRAAYNVRLLIERLNRLGYEFAQQSSLPPSTESRKEWRRVDRKLGALPLSLRAWWDVAGSVDLTGDHDLLSASGGLPGSKLGTLLTDPLVVYGPEATMTDFESAEGEEDGGPQCILAPDRYHKHGFSGGGEYAIAVPCRAADALVLNEPNRIHLVDYLRLCFQYGGFPGFQDEESKIPRREMALLTDGLLEI